MNQHNGGEKIRKIKYTKTYLLVFTLIFTLVILGTASAADNKTVGSITNTSQNLPDPKLYDHNANLVGSYTSIQDAYEAAAVGNSTHMNTIELEAGGTFDLQDFEIKKNLIFTVENGGTATINGLNHRLVHIYPGFTVYFYNITFQNGRAPDGTLLKPDGSNGGAIWNQGKLYLVNCTLKNNRAGDGGSFTYGGVGGDGGAIWTQGTLTITSSTIYNNRAGHGTIGVALTHSNGFNGGNGGAIYSTGSLTIIDSEIYNNVAGNGGRGVVLGDGGDGGSGGAIHSTNNMTITLTHIHDNYAGNAGAGGTEVIIGGTGGSGGNGGGIFCSGNGTTTITDSQINNNIAGNGGSGANGKIGGHAGHTGGPGGSGGAIYNAGDLKITNTTITNNTAGNGGIGGAGGNGISGLRQTGGSGGKGGQGGHAGGVFNSNYLIITESQVSSNHSGNGGNGGNGGDGSDRLLLIPSGNGGNGGNGGNAGFGSGIYHSGSQLEVISNNLTNNVLGTPGNGGTNGSKGSGSGGSNGNPGTSGSNGSGGALFASVSSQSLHFNRILGNTSPDIVAASGASIDAENNWWGSNDNPGSRISGNVDYGPWIMLRITANPGSIHYQSTSNITADLTWNSDNVQPTGGHVPDGIPTAFGVQTGPGNVNPNNSATGEGKSNTTYTGTATGTATIYAQVDNETQTININVDKANTSLVVDPSSGVYKGNTTLHATLKDEYGNAVVGVSVDFYVNGSYVATGTTNSSGVATVNYSPIQLNPAGSPYTIEVKFLGNDNFNGTTGLNNLTVNKANSTLTLVAASGTYKGSALLQAVLVDQYGDAVVGASVDFYINGTFVGTCTTNSSGIASVTFAPILLNPTSSPYNITAEFAGNNYYNGDNSTNQLTVNKANSILVANAASGVYKGSTTLSATLVDGNGSGLAGQTVNFYINGTLVGSGITNNSGFASLIYKPLNLNPAGGPYTITARFAGNNYYNASNNTNKLTVTKANTTLQVKNVTGNSGQTIKLTTTLKDMYNKPLSGYKVTFKVNGVNIGYGYTDTSGTATKNYLVKLKGGSYTINTSFAGNDYYSTSSGKGILKIPQADLYLKVKASKNNPTVGEIITITYKLGNYGPDTAEKTVLKLKIPAGMKYVSVRIDQGTITYNGVTKTVTWNLGNVVVGDPYLWLKVKIVKAGKYTLKPTITTITYDPNLSKNIQTLTINAKEAHTNKQGNGTIGMQSTGIPIGVLILAIFAVLAGMVIPKRK